MDIKVEMIEGINEKGSIFYGGKVYLGSSIVKYIPLCERKEEVQEYIKHLEKNLVYRDLKVFDALVHLLPNGEEELFLVKKTYIKNN